MKLLTAISTMLLLAALGAMPAWAGGIVNFSADAQASGENVTLADLAADADSLDPDLLEKLTQVVVMPTPSRNQSRNVSGDQVRSLVNRAGLPEDVSVLIPARIKVSRAMRQVTPDDLAHIYRQAINERLGNRAQRAVIRDINTGSGYSIPQGRLSTQVRLSGNEMLGRVPATVDIIVDGRRVRQARVVGTVDLYQKVLVATRTLERRHIIGPGDVELTEVNLAQAEAGVITELDSVVGLRTRTMLTAGEPLDVRQLERAPLIRRGDLVTMIYDSPGIKITAKGQAQQTGYSGSTIRLTNLVSKREVLGKVQDSGTVVVEF